MAEYKESDPFYHSRAWKRIRQQALSRDRGMCQDCMAKLRAGVSVKPRRAEMVHHIIPLEERPDLALRLDNLISLCNQCHNKRHPEKGHGNRPTANENARMRIIKV